MMKSDLTSRADWALRERRPVKLLLFAILPMLPFIEQTTTSLCCLFDRKKELIRRIDVTAVDQPQRSHGASACDHGHWHRGFVVATTFASCQHASARTPVNSFRKPLSVHNGLR